MNYEISLAKSRKSPTLGGFFEISQKGLSKSIQNKHLCFGNVLWRFIIDVNTIPY